MKNTRYSKAVMPEPAELWLHIELINTTQHQPIN